MSSKFKNFLISDAVIESITSSGAGVARTNHGAVIFVKNCIPGDIVDLEVFKKNYKSNILVIGDTIVDECGVCGGDGSTCLDNVISFGKSFLTLFKHD